MVQIPAHGLDADDASLNPPMAEVIQLDETYPNISVQTRSLGMAQPVVDAAVYILHVRSRTGAILIKELQAHMDILTANRSTMLIVTARVLPSPGSVDREVEAMCRVRDLTLMQLTNDYGPEVVGLEDLVRGVEDDRGGRLVVADTLRARNKLLVAFVVKYQGVSAPGPWPSSP